MDSDRTKCDQQGHEAPNTDLETAARIDVLTRADAGIKDALALLRADLAARHPEGRDHSVYVRAEGAGPVYFDVAWFTHNPVVQHTGGGDTYEAACAAVESCPCRICGKPCAGAVHPECGDFGIQAKDGVPR